MKNSRPYILATFFLSIIFQANLTAQPFGFGEQEYINNYLQDNNLIDSYPAIISDGRDTWIVVWEAFQRATEVYLETDSDLYFSRSVDNGDTWTTPTALNSNAAFPDQSDEMPFLATNSKGTWIVIWENSDYDVSLPDKLYFSRSTDNGSTWSEASSFITPAPAIIGRSQVAYGGEQTWMAAWNAVLTTNTQDNAELFYALSTDNGATWSEGVQMFENTDEVDRKNSYPQLMYDGMDSWLVVWNASDPRNSELDIDSDLFFSHFNRESMTWDQPEVLNPVAYDDYVDETHPRLATDGNGNWIVVCLGRHRLGEIYGNDRDVFFARSSDNGYTWTERAPIGDYAFTDSAMDRFPTIATDAGGNWLAAWDAFDQFGPTGPGHEVYVVLSKDNGRNWTAPQILHDTENDDYDNDLTPSIAANGLGRWIVAWSSPGTFDGSVYTGSDYEILYKISDDAILARTGARLSKEYD